MNLTSDDEQNWALLREWSLQPGGFGADRVRIWPALLGAQPLSDPPPYSEVDNTNGCEDPMEESMGESVADPHADERQIKLDTDRSFVLYPGDSGTTPARDTLQNDLHGLLVALFRKRRSLHYFQGFHDIMTVLFLTLSRPLHLACAEKMALHRVRDAMGVGLEPVLGLLRVLRNLLRLADSVYAELLESISPLPYHALSHLLTLFSHDVPTLALIQHAWDFLLSREPIAVVWLAAALILHRKPAVYLLAEQDEEGMIHSLLGGIPELVDAEPDSYDEASDDLARGQVTEMDRTTECGTFSEGSIGSSVLDIGEAGAREQPIPEFADDGTLGSPDVSGQTPVCCDMLTGDKDALHESAVTPNMVQNGDTLRADSPNSSANSISPLDEMDRYRVDGSQRANLEFAASIPLPDSRPASPNDLTEPSFSIQPTTSLSPKARSADHDNHSPTPGSVQLRSCSSLKSTHPSSVSTAANRPTTRIDTPVKTRTKAAPLPLTRLLRQADDLLSAYPPSHPSLRVNEIMGPDSATRTWRPLPITRSAVAEKPSYDETDDYLETLANSSRIVIPSPPPSPGPRLPAKKTRLSPRTSSKALLDPRRLSLRLGTLTAAERRMLFMGALLVVGAAMALRSSKVPCVDGIVKASGGDGLKRLWNGKWTFISSVVAAWGRGLP